MSEPELHIVYVGDNAARRRAADRLTGDRLVLYYDNWDDFGSKTYFPTRCWIGGVEVELGTIRILFEGEDRSHAYLERRLQDGWDGRFPIEDAKYISTPSSSTFYEQIVGHRDREVAKEVALALRDAGYMVRVLDDNTALKLIRTSAFENSLQRERGSQRAYIDGWRLLMGDDVEIDDINFTFEDPWGEEAVLDLKFVADNPLPHDINVLIGPNGVGKSQILQKMVAAWLDPRGSRENGRGVFSEQLNLSQMVVVSYSPFELFPVDATGHDLRDEGVYRYFGMRGRGNPRAPNPEVTSVSLNKLHSQKSAVESLIQCVRDDQRYGAIEEWSRKIPTMESVLATAIQFDFVALHVRPEGAQESLMREDPLIERDLIRVVDDDDLDMVDLYLPIARDRVTALKPNAIRRNVDATKGVVFFRDGEPINLSSGQRLFSYIVINILGVLRRNSLILVDEPELFLHPTLEIQFVEMLKEILAAYGSKALLATHSVVTVRETPADCVHVLERTDEGLVIKRPPFETFGGDIQRISSYVFGDSAVSKPYERWLERMMEEYGSGEALIAALGDHLNEEMIVQIQAMDQGQW